MHACCKLQPPPACNPCVCRSRSLHPCTNLAASSSGGWRRRRHTLPHPPCRASSCRTLRGSPSRPSLVALYSSLLSPSRAEYVRLPNASKIKAASACRPLYLQPRTFKDFAGECRLCAEHQARRGQVQGASVTMGKPMQAAALLLLASAVCGAAATVAAPHTAPMLRRARRDAPRYAPPGRPITRPARFVARRSPLADDDWTMSRGVVRRRAGRATRNCPLVVTA